ncbi:hypothetical protein [Streptomyces olivaceoviridis]|uniref:hypothetical protein n=1 Tax=Streptomyces olivaceoviridis TaxID=1921 RepID=UPI0016787882|nr:hypothetical protein [Streptomyces olivaceoviridis]
MAAPTRDDGSPDGGTRRQAAEPARRCPRRRPAPHAEAPRPAGGLGATAGRPRDAAPARLARSVSRRAPAAGIAVALEESANHPTVRALAAAATAAQDGSR